MAWDFEDFARRQVPSLLRSARLLVGSTGGAEDLVQETLVRLAQRWPRVSRMKNPAGYSYRTLVNQFLSDTRKHRVALEAQPRLAINGTGDSDLQRIDDLDELKHALADLPPRQRTAIVLRHYLDLDTRDVAKLMRIREPTVRSLLARGLASMRTTLTDHEGTQDGSVTQRP